MLRAPGKHIGVILVSLVLSGLLCFLSVYRGRQLTDRDEAIDSAEVKCVVTDLKGTQSDNLRMGWGAAQAVTIKEFYRLPEYVKDIRMTKHFKATVYELGAELELTAVTSPKDIEKLDPALGAELTLFRDDFYTSDQPLIIISEQAFEQLNGAETVSGAVTDPFINPDFFPDEPGKGRGTVEFTVAGYYKGTGASAYMPFEAGMLTAERISGMRSVDSLAFLAADNRKIDELRDAASDVFGTADPDLTSGEHRFALVIHDEELTEKLAALEQNIRRTNILIPASLALALAAGFLMGFISTRSEKNTYALSRSVGMTKKRLLFTALAEQLILPFAVCALTGAAFLQPLSAAAVFALYALGCVIAVIKAVSVSPTVILREHE